jgi:gamma-glutamylcyclotransferase (GGCT)/AIG2-like uncharacterized protein YtfP
MCLINLLSKLYYKPMKHIVFAYGTLRNKNVLKELLGRVPATYPSSLRGYRMDSILLGGIFYPIIMADPSSSELIKGEYFEVDELELEKLDIYESDAYRRIKIHLDENITAWVYCN